MEQPQFLDILHRSKFCLAPAGMGLSTRTLTVILSLTPNLNPYPYPYPSPLTRHGLQHARLREHSAGPRAADPNPYPRPLTLLLTPKP